MEYDKIIITNLPSFYKVNLYNLVAARRKILVIFTGCGASERNADFCNRPIGFDVRDLSRNGFWGRLISVGRLIVGCNYDELIISGFAEPAYWLAAMLSPKSKNSAVVESSYLESTVHGIKGALKRLFFKRTSKVYVSGAAQRKLVERLGFDGEVVVTRGVGVFNVVAQPEYRPATKVSKFLYVGRLAPEKNLFRLIEVFGRLREFTLTIVGYGPLEQELRSAAGSNITFAGPIDNSLMPDIYRLHDVFVLPSKSEPWGLVVEEALNNGLPVAVSDRVGCAEEIVRHMENGVVFRYDDSDSLARALVQMADVQLYNRMRKNIAMMDFDAIEKYQVDCYCR